jgi:hypothetical protein
MKALWVKEKGLNPSMKGIALSSTQQYYWHASCGLHYRLVQPNTVKKALQREAAGLRCFICDALSTHVSRHVPPVQQATEATEHFWLPEVHCLRGHCSPADIWLPGLKLAVQIDGAGHQFVDVYSKTLEQQQETDRFFDNEIVRQGLRALRIHYRDAEQPAAVLAAAIHLCQEEPNKAFVMYSQHYARPLKLAVDVEHMEVVDRQVCIPQASAGDWLHKQVTGCIHS